MKTLIYSEISCNKCVDSLIIGCKNIAKYKNNNVIGIVHSSNIDYIKRFARINNLKFPLLWDKEKKLIKTLGLKYLPALLMINEEGVIINSFIIMPEIRELNPVFIEAALNWVNE